MIKSFSLPLTITLLLSSLNAGAVDIEFRSSVKGFEFTNAEKALIREIANDAEVEIRVLLPGLSEELVLEVEASTFVIPQTGELGASQSTARVKWAVDPTRDGGVSKIAKGKLRHTLFHEFHHLVSGYIFAVGKPVNSIMDAAVNEGMATVFARDFSGAVAPWADYPENIDSWVTELQGVTSFEEYDQWMYQHPDGRSWIGYKVGTYLIDRAIKATGKSSVELINASPDEIIRLGR
ncbi:MAG: DUF2268 domain-containing putative Zn-dependent protease [Pseudomonadales bacterium]